MIQNESQHPQGSSHWFFLFPENHESIDTRLWSSAEIALMGGCYIEGSLELFHFLDFHIPKQKIRSVSIEISFSSKIAIKIFYKLRK